MIEKQEEGPMIPNTSTTDVENCESQFSTDLVFVQTNTCILRVSNNQNPKFLITAAKAAKALYLDSLTYSFTLIFSQSHLYILNIGFGIVVGMVGLHIS